jgi:hypothetical protein
MSDSEELARKEERRRRRLIERLNEKEKLIGSHGPGRPDERRGAGSGDREAKDTERRPARFYVLASSFSIQQSAWKGYSRKFAVASSAGPLGVRDF